MESLWYIIYQNVPLDSKTIDNNKEQFWNREK